MGNASDHTRKSAWVFYKNPRWTYDNFVPAYIIKPRKFAFVQKHYDRQLSDFVRELPELGHRFITVQGLGSGALCAETIVLVQQYGIHSLYAFLDQVPTQAQAETFLKVSGITQPGLMSVLDYVKQWWFPYPANMRLLTGDDSPQLLAELDKLKTAKIANNMTLLEAAAEPRGRADLALQTGIADAVLLDLVHRADVARLPYTSSAAIRRLWAMGYCSLAAIQAADVQDFYARVTAYFDAGGIGTSFDRRLEVVKGFLRDVRCIPMVVKEA